MPACYSPLSRRDCIVVGVAASDRVAGDPRPARGILETVLSSSTPSGITPIPSNNGTADALEGNLYPATTRQLPDWQVTTVFSAACLWAQTGKPSGTTTKMRAP